MAGIFWRDEVNGWVVLLLGALGVGVVALGVLGRRKSIDSVLDAASNHLVSGLLDAF